MIALGSDHAGLPLKEEIKQYLDAQGLDYKDFGTFSLDSCHYPVYAEAVARSVASGESSKGLLFCGTGIGVAISANKVKGIRAAVCSDTYSAEMSRRHNNANILALGARVVGPGLAEQIVALWLNTPFEAGRHTHRVNLVDNIQP